MKLRISIIMFLLLFICCAAAGAADYKFTYKKGTVDVTKDTVKTGKDSSFALSYGAACEVRCGPESLIEINNVTKTGESVFTLKAGSCFIRIIDDSSGASVTLNTPFVVLKTRGSAFYACYSGKTTSVYDGSARIEFNKRMAKLTAGRTFKDGKIWENQPGEDLWRDWNFSRDKTDIFMKLQADKKNEELIIKFLSDALAKGYSAGKIVFKGQAEPQELKADIKIEAKKDELIASGLVSSEVIGTAGIVNVSRKTESTASPYESAVFLPLVYETASAILGILEQKEAEAMKRGRKVIIEAEGLPDSDLLSVEKAVGEMPGFVSVKQKKYHNTKVVFEVLQAGTGNDMAETLLLKLKKTNINIWKYSKNIVKLRVLKVER
jgi:hypothetical protein